MPDPISATTPSVQGTQNASFDRTEPSATSASQTGPQDVVDITITEGETPSTSSAPKTYGPATVADRFRFEIQNGMFDRSLRFNALNNPFDETAVNTYEARESLMGQMAQGAQGALFALQYNAAQPDPETATTHINAKTEQNRQFDQKLTLLNML